MVDDPRATALADTLIDYSLDLTAAENVYIQHDPDPAVTSFAADIYQMADAAGINPYFEAPPAVDALLVIKGGDTTPTVSDGETDDTAWMTAEYTPSDEFRWCQTMYPTADAAKTAGMSLDTYRDMFYTAALSDREDAINTAKALNPVLEEGETIEIRSDDTDLALSTTSGEYISRDWVIDDGHNNMPCGEIYTSPVKESVNGYITFPRIRINQTWIEDAQLTFDQGELTDYQAATGDQQLAGLADTSVSEVGIGTNPHIHRLTGESLLDEKMHGTFHLGLGGDGPETYILSFPETTIKGATVDQQWRTNQLQPPPNVDDAAYFEAVVEYLEARNTDNVHVDLVKDLSPDPETTIYIDDSPLHHVSPAEPAD